MQKAAMRDWISQAEEALDAKLIKFKKANRIENGEVVQLRWQFEQAHITLEIFWEDKKETVHLSYIAPRSEQKFLWHGLNGKTLNKIMDRIGNLAQTTLNPPVGSID